MNNMPNRISDTVLIMLYESLVDFSCGLRIIDALNIIVGKWVN
jgi:hypothetical protein